MRGGLFDIDLTEVESYARRLAEAADVEEPTRKAVARTLRRIADGQRTLAPIGATGEAHDTIGEVIDPDGMGGISGTEAWYGHLIEGGTQTASPRPFIFPPLDNNEAYFEAQIDKVAADALRELGR